MVELKNEQLAVQIDPVGAQLCSVLGADGVQYLWQADPAVWGRHAPILFPVIGRLRDGEYLLDGTPWHISSHGFARDSQFTLAEQSAQRAAFQLTSSADTRAVYPFDFTLTVVYTLSGRTLTKTHHVENRSGCDMLYELGGHDGFCVPLVHGETASDYRIRLPGSSAIQPYEMDAQAMMAPKRRTIPLTEETLPISPAEYGLDTIVLDQFQEKKAILLDGSGAARVTLTFDDFDFLGIWSVPQELDHKFVCLEPWTSLPDAVFCGRELADKRGIRRLAPGQRETLTYTVQFS